MTNNEYKIQLVNVDMHLPVEVLTEMGTAKFIIDKKELRRMYAAGELI